MGTTDALDDRKTHQVVYQIQSQPCCLLSSPPNYHSFREKKPFYLLVLKDIQKVIIRSTRFAELFFSFQNIFSGGWEVWHVNCMSIWSFTITLIRRWFLLLRCSCLCVSQFYLLWQMSFEFQMEGDNVLVTSSHLISYFIKLFWWLITFTMSKWILLSLKGTVQTQ